MKKHLVPKGLRRCSRCGEYRGYVEPEDLPAGHDWFKTMCAGRPVEVLCICEGKRCRVCGKKKIHRICSNYYDEKDGCLWHVPGFIAWSLTCSDCLKKMGKNIIF